MRTLLTAAAAITAATLSFTAPAKADSVGLGNDICDVTFGSYNNGWATSQGGLDCVKGTFNNREWIWERLKTQIHYFNKVTEKLGMDHTGGNGAYWGHVTTARDMIDRIKEDRDTNEQMYHNQNAKVIVMCSDLQAAGTIPVGSEIEEICSATDTGYAGYTWEDVAAEHN